jgi:hypothetical protein
MIKNPPSPCLGAVAATLSSLVKVETGLTDSLLMELATLKVYLAVQQPNI